MNLPDLFHFKYAYDDNFTEAENECFRHNYDNYYIYDSFTLEEITKDSILWALEFYPDESKFEKLRDQYFEIKFFCDGQGVTTTRCDRAVFSGLELNIAHSIEEITKIITGIK